MRSYKTNSQMNPKDIKEFATPDLPGRKLIEMAMKELHLSARAYYKILKMSRTKIGWKIVKRFLVELYIELRGVIVEWDPVDELPKYPVLLLVRKLVSRETKGLYCLN